LVIKASLFISGVSKPDDSSQLDEKSYILAPEIFALPDATNSARIVLNGRGTEETDVHIYVNDEKVDSIALTSEDFSTEVSLKKGENEIYLESEDVEKKRVKTSKTYKVLYLAEKPTLSIESPKEGDTVSTSETFVKGTTDPSVAIRVNGGPAVVGVDGSFTYSARLKDGDNEIKVEATDIAGNQEVVTLKVRYEKDE
ncbi:hypothetical protein KBC70_00005, partial [Candidatus Woesebacteria bacterium]|nr:hypothetical protein [Candidatus Woesebacteria bacterium]